MSSLIHLATGKQKVKAAAYQRDNYYSQARQSVLKGRMDALAYKREGTEMLRNLQKVMATATARGAAGGLLPFATGESTDLINTASLRGAANEFSIMTDNSLLANQMAKMQSDNLRRAGDIGVQMARKNAKIGFFKGLMQDATMGLMGGGQAPMNSGSMNSINVSGGQNLGGAA